MQLYTDNYHSINVPMHAAMYRFQMSYLRPPIPQVNMLRVTGRPEAVGQKLPPWGYGDSFDEGKLPPSLKALVQKVRAISGLSLGPLRDVTVNYRHSHFYRLDPHVDPQLDGDHVFIIGLDSDTVLTLCPLNVLKLTKWINNIWSILTLEDERDLVQRQAYKSWTSSDLDVLLKKNTLVLLTGDARWRWTHGTRLGIQVPDLSGLHDWWGDHTLVVEREGERSSVVLAFACLE
ncbi:hypothetical protein CEUSTIGMA_g2492.t1 [Chlamydomonas eustigma]|uniref:Alpha-ketoglutarate-dependent dioxygenase AlkB-like domain-containing protein n=1 Tax=Chlamydomonas eustigma TaxID=1157962 RepID=A0A250WW41_9CHLO|nr:hypothetical protein CEUSTIGMA_g2492.t1 [Chlamydomonas eustigma]|eukprot:GAX75048.1 hypothetical protein CEUSTIGMA_g2492.t1 [Chlamydomonas eustigma]